MRYHTKVGIISIIIILLLLLISIILSLNGYFAFAYNLYTKSFEVLGFIFVGDMIYKWLTYGGKSKKKDDNSSSVPSTPKF